MSGDSEEKIWVKGPDGKAQWAPASRASDFAPENIISKEEADARLKQQTIIDRGERMGVIEGARAGAVDAITMGGAAAISKAIGGEKAADYWKSAEYAPGHTIGTIAGVVGGAELGSAELGAAKWGTRLLPGAGASWLGNLAERYAAKAIPEGVSTLGGIASRGAGMVAKGAVEGGLFDMTKSASDLYLDNKPITSDALASHFLSGAALGGGVGAMAGTGAGLLKLGARATENAIAKSAARTSGGLEARLSSAAAGTEAGALGEELTAGARSGLRPDELRGIVDKAERDAFTARKSLLKDLDSNFKAHAPSAERFADRVEREVLQEFEGTAHFAEASRVANEIVHPVKATYLSGAAKNPWTSWARDSEMMAQKPWAVLQGKQGFEFTDGVRNKVRGIFDAEMRIALEEAAATSPEAAQVAKQMMGLNAQAAFTKEARAVLDEASHTAGRQPRGVLPTASEATRAAAMGILTGHPLGAVGYLGANTVGRAVKDGFDGIVKSMGGAANATRIVQELDTAIQTSVKKYFTAQPTAAMKREALGSVSFDDKDLKKAIAETNRMNSPQAKRDFESYAMEISGNNRTAMNNLIRSRENAVNTITASMPKSRSLKSNQLMMGNVKSKGLSMDEVRHIKVFNAVTNTKSMLKGLSNGTIGKTESDAFKSAYPEAHASLVYAVTTHLAEAQARGEAVDVNKQMQLSFVLGAPVSPMADPEFVATIQQVFAKDNQKQEPKPSQAVSPSAQAVASSYAVTSDKVMG